MSWSKRIGTALLFALTAGQVSAKDKPLIVAVIDTGISPDVELSLCDKGHKDFTGTGILDTDRHGTNISGVIEKFAAGHEYCQVILKYYSSLDKGSTIQHTIDAFTHAIKIGASVINYSSYGNYPNSDEKALIVSALDKGITIVVPSGNQRVNLDKECNVYPACYDSRLIVVGRTGEKPNHGYGKIVDRLENGTDINGFGIVMSGTSQATATATGKIIAIAAKRRKREKARSIGSTIVE